MTQITQAVSDEVRDLYEPAPVTKRFLPSRPTEAIPWLVSAFLVLQTIGHFVDPDVFWHVLAGRQVWHHGPLTQVGAGWNFGTPAHIWRSSEWLAEVMFAGLQHVLGWPGILLVRPLLMIAILAVLAAQLRRVADPRWAALVFAAAALPVAVAVQERPQTVSFLLIAWLGGMFATWMKGGELPSAWLLVVVAVWANMHGLWVLAPAALALAGACRLVDEGLERSAWLASRRWFAAAGAAALVGCLSPNGFGGLLLPLRMRSATPAIIEWQSPSLLSGQTWGLVAMVAAWVVAVARKPDKVSRSEVLAVLVYTAFALLAYRNLAPGALLLAPLVARRMSSAYPSPPVRSTAREQRVLGIVCVTALAGTFVMALAGPWLVSPFGERQPIRIARDLAKDGKSHLVLNNYNVSGLLLAFGNGHVRTAIDGRADYWGAKYISDYGDLMLARPGTLHLLDSLKPTDAVMDRHDTLVDVLRSRGWIVREREHDWVWLTST